MITAALQVLGITIVAGASSFAIWRCDQQSKLGSGLRSLLLPGSCFILLVATAGIADLYLAARDTSPAHRISLILLAQILAALAITDFRVGLLPNELVALVGLAGIAASALNLNPMAGITSSFAGMLAGWAWFLSVRYGYRRLRGFDGLGLGDVKLAAAAGGWVGVEHLPGLVFASAMLTMMLAIALKVRRQSGRIPLGPALAVVTWAIASGLWNEPFWLSWTY